MKCRKIAALVLVFGLSTFFCSLSRVSALTNEEMIKLLDERFVKSEISEENYDRLRKKYGDTDAVPTKPAKAIRVKGITGNLIQNSGFELDADNNGIPDGWSEGGEKVVCKVSSDSYSGNVAEVHP